jgi:hypothetical protein
MTTGNVLNTELGQVPIFDMPLFAIRPAEANDRLYRPVDPEDPDIAALADSIREHGLREPLVITIDNVILSGHRRYAACKLARLVTVPCRREGITSTDPGFLPLLREYNRQRVKSLDEILREEVVSASPEEAYGRLLEHRRRQSRVKVATIPIEGQKHRARITAAKAPFLDAILDVLRQYRDFLPLSVRQIHYYLLNAPPLIHARKPGSRYRNDLKSYKALDELVTRARLEGRIAMEDIHDPTRPVVTWDVHRQPAGFIRRHLGQFLKGYCRDLQQSQPNHIEIIGEKNTVQGVIEPVAMDYCIPCTLGRGYSSLPPRAEMRDRFDGSGKERLVLLVLSDFDPEGEDIGHSFARSLRDDLGIEHIHPIKVALTHDQVRRMSLPSQMKAKRGSSRRTKFVERHGDDVFELEAVPPERLQALLRETIDGVLDVKAFNAEVEAEKRDAAYLDGIRRRLETLLRGELGDPT